MPKGPVDTVFDDYVGSPIPNKGKSVAGNNYDQFSGTGKGDSDSGGYLGEILTSMTIAGVGPDDKINVTDIKPGDKV